MPCPVDLKRSSQLVLTRTPFFSLLRHFVHRASACPQCKVVLSLCVGWMSIPGSSAATATATSATGGQPRVTVTEPQGIPEPLAPHRLRVEYLDAPLTVDHPVPRFSWALGHTGRAQTQTHYRITVWGNPAVPPSGPVAPLWASGLVLSNQTLNVPYDGSPLASDTDYRWTVLWMDAQVCRSRSRSRSFLVCSSSISNPPSTSLSSWPFFLLLF
jgi:hypothetical protein